MSNFGKPFPTPMRISDYEQNDPKKSDYIKNRPFYENNELLGQTVILYDGESDPVFEIYYNTLSVGDKVFVEVEKEGKTETFEDTIVLIDDNPGLYSVAGEKTWEAPCAINGVYIRIVDSHCVISASDVNVEISVRVYKMNGVKQLDEKFIPESIARVKDVEKLIGESGGVSGESIQTDYDQNDATQPDFLKNRPFYKEKILLTEEKVEPIYGQYGDDKWVEGANMPAGELSNIEVDGVVEILIEVNDNEEISTHKGYFDGWSICDSEFMPLSFCNGKLNVEGVYDDKLNFECGEEIGDVNIKIFIENIKTLDKEYLPKCDVPYIYSDTAEDVVFGRVVLYDLESGAYLLHGVFDIVPMGNCIYDFANKPTLCHITNDQQGTIKLYWLDEDENYDYGVCVRFMRIDEGDITFDETYSLLDIATCASDAAGMAGTAYDTATNAQDGVYALFEEIGSLQEGVDVVASAAEEALSVANSVVEGEHIFPSIPIDNGNGVLFSLTVGDDGSVVITNWNTETTYEHATKGYVDDVVGDIDAALDAILEIDAELLTPNGDEVEY